MSTAPQLPAAEARPSNAGRSAYRDIGEATRAALTWRSSLYLRLVVSVATICVAAFGSLLVSKSAWPLLTLLTLVPIVSAFLVADLRATQRWRADVLKAWGQDRLQIEVLERTLPQVPGFPPQTTAGLLGSIPPWARANVALAARQQLVESQGVADRVAIWHGIRRTLVWLLIAAAGLLQGWPK